MPGELMTLWPSGKLVNPLRVRVRDLHIRDLAHHGAMLTRYGGGTRCFYSVNEHELAVSELLERWHPEEPVLWRWGLVHDTAESLLGEIRRGLKHRRDMAWYRRAEAALLEKITRKLGLPWPEPRAVKEADRLVCSAEMRQLCMRACTPSRRRLPPAPPGLVLGVLSPEAAETRWLARFVDLWGPAADRHLGFDQDPR